MKGFYLTPAHRLWAGVNCYLASDANNRTVAVAISRAKNKRFMACLSFWLAPRRAQAVRKRKATVRRCYILLAIALQRMTAARESIRLGSLLSAAYRWPEP